MVSSAGHLNQNKCLLQYLKLVRYVSVFIRKIHLTSIRDLGDNNINLVQGNSFNSLTSLKIL